jgi:hypothetical protein
VYKIYKKYEKMHGSMKAFTTGLVLYFNYERLDFLGFNTTYIISRSACAMSPYKFHTSGYNKCRVIKPHLKKTYVSDI